MKLLRKVSSWIVDFCVDASPDYNGDAHIRGIALAVLIEGLFLMSVTAFLFFLRGASRMGFFSSLKIVIIFLFATIFILNVQFFSEGAKKRIAIKERRLKKINLFFVLFTMLTEIFIFGKVVDFLWDEPTRWF